MVTDKPVKDKNEYAERCWGRFSGDPLPKKEKSITRYMSKWVVYIIRIILIHFPGRFGVIVGDLPAHDWHHLAGYMKMSSVSWPTALYERQRAIDDGDPLRLQDREIWGLDRALAHVFRKLSAAEKM